MVLSRGGAAGATWIFRLPGTGHAAPGGNYHYHFPPSCLLAQVPALSDGHSPQIGWAYDGFPIYGPYGAGGVEIRNCGSSGADATYPRPRRSLLLREILHGPPPRNIHVVAAAAPRPVPSDFGSDAAKTIANALRCSELGYPRRHCQDACGGYEGALPDVDDFEYRDPGGMGRGDAAAAMSRCGGRIATRRRGGSSAAAAEPRGSLQVPLLPHGQALGPRLAPQRPEA